jgi:hypothetical protein
MKIYFEAYPFPPRSGRITEESDSQRIERYYRKATFEGDFFDIVFEKDADGFDKSFSIIEYAN